MVLDLSGTHTVIELIQAGHQVVVVDNLVNSNRKSLEVVERITGVKIPFMRQISVTQIPSEIFSTGRADWCHSLCWFWRLLANQHASLCAYYDNNIAGTVRPSKKPWKKITCKNIIFSSSVTVYGDPHTVPILEDFPLSVTNPYGRTKLMLEEILTDIYKADSQNGTWYYFVT